MADQDFSGGKAINVGDARFNQDAVNLRTATRMVENSKISASTFSNGINTTTFNDNTQIIWTGGCQYYILSASSTNTTTNSISLFNIPLLVTGTFQFSAFLRNGCSGSGGTRFQIFGPSTSIVTAMFFGQGSASTTFLSSVVTSLSSNTAIYNNMTASTAFVKIDGEITTTTTGNFAIAYNSVISGQTSTIFNSGTTLSMWKVK